MIGSKAWRISLVALLLAGAASSPAAAPTSIALPGTRTFVESIGSTSDGTIYVGNLGEGGILKVKGGKVTVFAPPGAYGTRSIYGVFPDEAHGLLWVCTNDLSRYGQTVAGDAGSAVKAFDLKTGKGWISAAFPPGPAECNDIAVAPDGTAYITDTAQPRVLKLAPGATAVEIWLTDPRFDQKGSDTDGIAFGADGQLYVDTLDNSRIYRVEITPSGTPGTVTEIKTSRPLEATDALRHYKGNDFLVIEAGRLSRVTITGDTAVVTALRDGLDEPTGVAVSGNIAWVSEGRLSYVFNRAKRGQTPPLPFRLQAVPLSER